MRERFRDALPASLKLRLRLAAAESSRLLLRLASPLVKLSRREKWRDASERDRSAYDPSLCGRAADRERGPHVLVIDDTFPTPDRDAGSARMIAILEALSEWSRPVFIAASKSEQPAEERRLWEMGIETARVLEYKRLLRGREFCAAVVSRPHVADALVPAIRRADRRVRIIYDMVDAHFVRLGREYELTGDAATLRAAARSRKVEARLARESDLVWCASTEDAKAIGREAPGVALAVVPTIHAPRGRGEPFERRAHLLFIGNLRHRPNADGLLHYLREIHPLVLGALPGVVLHVVGSGVSDEINALASSGVRIHGYVPDAGPLFRGSRVLVAPLRYGAGAKGKVGEALAHGLPVVTTPIGAEGMGFTAGRDLMVADSPRAFAEAVARVYLDRDLWQRLSDEGYAFVEDRLSPRVVGRIINDSVRGLAGRAPGSKS